MTLQVSVNEKLHYTEPADGEPLLSEDDIEFLFTKISSEKFEPFTSSLLELS